MKHDKVDKRERWFNDGAYRLRFALEDLRRPDQLPATGDFYACPLCLVIIPRSALNAEQQLTKEHVPPKRLGGREMLLTCGPCNHRSGSELDIHAIKQAALDNFVVGQDDAKAELDATFEFDGITVRGTAKLVDGGIRLMGVAKRNDRRVGKEFVEHSTRVWNEKDPSAPITVTISGRSSPARATISWIRAAYLAAFAALGWRYIAQPELEPVRAQIANPDSEILPPLDMLDFSIPADQRLILLADSPKSVRSVVVAMGQHAIFLPAWQDPAPCADLSQALRHYADADSRLSVQLSGKKVPWPSSPQYLLDRDYPRP